MARQEWMYAIPFGIGDAIYGYDRYKDNLQKQSDYSKNTGRSVRYGSDSYSSGAYRSLGSAVSRAGRVGRSVKSILYL